MLRERIAEHRDDVLEAWFDRITSGYPDETSRFLRGQRDPFHNPVGAGLKTELAAILDVVLDDRDIAAIEPSLDRIVRVRALQDFSPAAAVGFVPQLKHILRDVEPFDDPERVAIEDRIDRVTLLAVDVYCRCRDAVAEIRIEAIRNRSLKVMQRFNAWAERRAAAPNDVGAADTSPTERLVAAQIEEGGGS